MDSYSTSQFSYSCNIYFTLDLCNSTLPSSLILSHHHLGWSSFDLAAPELVSLCPLAFPSIPTLRPGGMLCLSVSALPHRSPTAESGIWSATLHITRVEQHPASSSLVEWHRYRNYQLRLVILTYCSSQGSSTRWLFLLGQRLFSSE